MPPLLQCHRLTHSIGTKTLFQQLDLTINKGDRVGLIGHNGSGKSTLLSILNSRQDPDDGDISRHRDLQLETVEQFIDAGLLQLSLLEAVLVKLPEEERSSGRYRAELLLTRLGFHQYEYDFQVSGLSGGQQNRLMFARAMITSPNLILFDEPTNHLDLRTLLIFEQYLRNMRAGFLIISHDRQFLDSVTNRTVFLRDERLYNFDMSYTAAKAALDDFDAAANAVREQEEKTIKRLEASARRLAIWGKDYDNEKLARKAKSMEKRIDKLKAEKTYVSKGSGLNLTIEVGSAQANRMLAVEQQNILAPDNSPLFYIPDLMIRPGERVALLGYNGAGKSTFMTKVMYCYQQDKAGDFIKFNPQCQIGYYDQEMQHLDPSLSLMDTLRENCGGSDSDLKTQLILAGFPYLDLDKKAEVLSGGEKARLMFLMIKLNQPNFLILDEPTNHIDIQGKEELESQILASNATVLITSHDRRFVDNIADRYLMISEGTLSEINHPDVFYATEPTSITKNNHKEDVVRTAFTEEELLERIIALEDLIAADLARKPKFQKPALQAAWHAEVAELTSLIET